MSKGARGGVRGVGGHQRLRPPVGLPTSETRTAVRSEMPRAGGGQPHGWLTSSRPSLGGARLTPAALKGGVEEQTIW